MNIANFRRRLIHRRPGAPAPLRSRRPLVEQLESRELLAFNLTISTAETVHVTKNVSSNCMKR
jgi:hypothetical protein